MFASAALLLATGAVADRPALTVDKIIARHEALNGKIVRVRGWLLQRCYRYGCAIQAGKASDSQALSIGGSASFDRSLDAAKALGQQIVVEGRVDRTCFEHPKGDPSFSATDIVICSDRAGELADPKLIRVIPSQEK